MRDLANAASSSTMSLTDSIFSAIEENGRSYHSFKDGKYVLPNDEREQDRLDLQNHLFGLTLDGKLHLAPIDPNPQNVLDIGTGTGIWAIDFANMYPSANVIGTDLSVVQPLYVPPNLRFEICDAEEEWDFSAKFDYIHGRMLLVCFRDIREVFRNAFNALKPGGWLEMQDACAPGLSDDGTMAGTAIERWFGNLIEAGVRLGRPYGTEVPKYASYFEEIGFVDVQVEIRKWPFGPWPKDKKMKELGIWGRANLLEGLQAVSMAALTRGLGWTRQEVEMECMEVRKELFNPAIHTYLPM
jgi:ubiquinone/menaquinone biosynthesis C-methylase UbiE